MRKLFVSGAVAGLVLVACSGSDNGASPASSAVATVETTTGTPRPPETTTAPGPQLLAAAASRSVLPTVGGTRDYLQQAPGWLVATDPNDIGVFVPKFDQGVVDVGNGEGDGSWVHDDIRTTALVLTKGDQQVIMVNADVYMIFAVDQDEIERRIRRLLPAELSDASIVISATHNHHGPDTAFSVNDDWYDLMATEMAATVKDAVDKGVQPATLAAAAGEHFFGQADARDPNIVDPRVNLMEVLDADGKAIATVVQWASHPESTLGWEPPGDYSAQCTQKGWSVDDCKIEGRYFTADYPGVLRERLQKELGGEVLYFNGALGSQIGPGRADVWQIDAEHPEGDGVTPPAGAQPVPGAKDFRDRNLARTAAIGNALADAALALVNEAQPVQGDDIEWKRQEFYTRLTNIGFRVLLSDGDLGWQSAHGYTCTGKPFTDANCTDDDGKSVDDPVLTPLVDSQIRVADVLKTRLTWVRIGDIGFLFMPGELPPELVIGLPDDFITNTAKYYADPTLHATGADYQIPGALLDLAPTAQTFTIGLGGDELGYWTPINEVRLKCLDLVMPAGSGVTCQQLFDKGLLVAPDAVDGPTCRGLTEAPPSAPTADETALMAVCRYGQALGRELGEPQDHYEETNSAGWDLVDDTWVAAQQLFKD
jgi:hypothetical protein